MSCFPTAARIIYQKAALKILQKAQTQLNLVEVISDWLHVSAHLSVSSNGCYKKHYPPYLRDSFVFISSCKHANFIAEDILTRASVARAPPGPAGF